MKSQADANPFDLNDHAAYDQWRHWKLSTGSEGIKHEVAITDPRAPRDGELAAIRHGCLRRNWVLVKFATPESVDSAALTAFAAELGLSRMDHNLGAEESGLTALTTKEQKGHRYIPYTDRPMSWHTDGYYNDGNHQIRGMVLYCAQDAAEGGENEILDHELAYIALRDKDPGLIASLMANDVMTIPANEEGGEQIRPDHSGPVFSVDPAGNLHMRYSARKRNVIWKNDAKTQEASREILALFSDAQTPIFRYRMEPGDAIVANNVLHRREGFKDDPQNGKKRLYYRARFYDRIAHTGIRDEA